MGGGWGGGMLDPGSQDPITMQLWEKVVLGSSSVGEKVVLGSSSVREH